MVEPLVIRCSSKVCLRTAFQTFTQWAQQTGSANSHPDFTVAGLGLNKGLLSDWPELDAKAHNCMVVTLWLSEVVTGHVQDVHGRCSGINCQNALPI